jgi:hypothetical protein
LHYVGDYDWIIRVIAKVKLGRLPFFLSEVRTHPTQASRQFRQTMLAEQKRVVAKYHVDPFLFNIFRSAYIMIHDVNKLRFALASGGFTGAKKLILNHLRRMDNTRE